MRKVTPMCGVHADAIKRFWINNWFAFGSSCGLIVFSKIGIVRRFLLSHQLFPRAQFTVERKGHTASGVIQLPLEMFITPTVVFSVMCSLVTKCFIIRPIIYARVCCCEASSGGAIRLTKPSKSCERLYFSVNSAVGSSKRQKLTSLLATHYFSLL